MTHTNNTPEPQKLGLNANTHNVTITFGKHKGTLLTRVPASYIRWIVNEFPPNTEWGFLARAEQARRGNSLPTMELSGHAIDRASLRVRKIWHETALSEEEGLYSWLMRVATEAKASGVPDGDKIIYSGMQFVFEDGEEFPVLKSVLPAKPRQRELESPFERGVNELAKQIKSKPHD